MTYIGSTNTLVLIARISSYLLYFTILGLYAPLLFVPSLDDVFIGAGSSNLFFVFGSILTAAALCVLACFFGERRFIVVLISLATVTLCVISFIAVKPENSESVWLRIMAAKRYVLGDDANSSQAKIVSVGSYFDYCSAILIYFPESAEFAKKSIARDLVIKQMHMRFAWLKETSAGLHYIALVGCAP